MPLKKERDVRFVEQNKQLKKVCIVECKDISV